MHPSRFLAFAFLPALLLAAACSSKDDGTVDPGDPARIVDFLATPTTARVGEPLLLSWATDGVSSVRILDGEEADIDLKGAGPASGSVEVLPVAAGRASFSLLATSRTSGDVLRRTIDVQVAAAAGPRIDWFRATPQTLQPFETTTLSWSTRDATRVVIENDLGEVLVDSPTRLSDAHVVQPTRNDTFILTAHGARGETVTATVQIELLPAGVGPSIESFEASADRFDGRDGGKGVTFSWVTKNADSLEMFVGSEREDLDGRSRVQDSILLPITETTVVRLIATNDFGATERQVVVRRIDPPTIEFSSSAHRVTAGEEFTLSWTTTDAKTVELFQDDVPVDAAGGPPSPNGQVPVQLDETATFTLRVTNEYDVVSEETLRVEVGEAGLADVGVSPGRAAIGEEVTISWVAFGGDRVVVRDPDGEPVEGCDFTDRPDVEAGSCTVQRDSEGSWIYSIDLMSGDDVVDTKTAGVWILEGALILEFTATPVVEVGFAATVTWKTAADVDGTIPTLALELDGAPVDVSDRDPLQEDSMAILILTAGTHTLTLTASTDRGTSPPAEVTIEGVEP